MFAVLRLEPGDRRRAKMPRPMGERRLLRAEQAQHGKNGDQLAGEGHGGTDYTAWQSRPFRYSPSGKASAAG